VSFIQAEYSERFFSEQFGKIKEKIWLIYWNPFACSEKKRSLYSACMKDARAKLGWGNNLQFHTYDDMRKYFEVVDEEEDDPDWA